MPRCSTADLAISRRRNGLNTYFRGPREDFGLAPFFQIHLLQTPILLLERFHAQDHGNIHATELGSPFLKRGRTHANLATSVGNLGPGINSLENLQDLSVTKTGLFHLEHLPLEKILLLLTAPTGGGLPLGAVSYLCGLENKHGNVRAQSITQSFSAPYRGKVESVRNLSKFS
jgi:hypothetical protein